ncbi:probable Dynein regulatory complex subunit 2 [Coccomyxa sp. Obi]|nr:probable Dynein regulatory complex subunit 2 [Coccomyxa sp. Obi]
MAREETAEDRLARLEAEAIFAQEAAKLREEAARARVLERHTREQELVRVNAPRVHNEWRQKMRAAKLEELKAEVKIMMENHEHAVECRDSIIQSLDQELEEAEEQHVRAYHSHMRCMDVLLQLNAARSTFIQQQFDKNVKALQADYGKQKQEIRASFTAAKADIEAMMAAGREHFSTSGAAAQLAFETAKAEAQEGDSEEYNVLKLSLEAQVSEVRRLLDEAQLAHHKNTHAKAQTFKELSQSDAETTAVLAAKAEIHRELADALSHWRSRALITARDWSAQVAGLTAERAKLQSHHSTLKASLQSFRADQNARLKLLCRER